MKKDFIINFSTKLIMRRGWPGLSINYDIIKVHSEKIAIKSQRREYTQFKIMLSLSLWQHRRYLYFSSATHFVRVIRSSLNRPLFRMIRHTLQLSRDQFISSNALTIGNPMFDKVTLLQHFKKYSIYKWEIIFISGRMACKRFHCCSTEYWILHIVFLILKM